MRVGRAEAAAEKLKVGRARFVSPGVTTFQIEPSESTKHF
jgi:hypothetical protein